MEITEYAEVRIGFFKPFPTVTFAASVFKRPVPSSAFRLAKDPKGAKVEPLDEETIRSTPSDRQWHTERKAAGKHRNPAGYRVFQTAPFSPAYKVTIGLLCPRVLCAPFAKVVERGARFSMVSARPPKCRQTLGCIRAYSELRKRSGLCLRTGSTPARNH